MTELLLVAASGLAREVMAAVEAGGQHLVIGVLDDDPALLGTSIGGVPVLGAIDAVDQFPAVGLVVCAGRGVARRSLVRRLTAGGVAKDRFETVIDPSVHVPTTCTVGAGSIVLAQCVLTADVVVGRHVVMMPHVTLTHDNRVADYATLCAGVTLGGSVQVGTAAYLGMNSSVRERVSVGSEAVLGMGAALLCDLPAHQTWAGVPAKRLSTPLATIPFPRNFETEMLGA